MGQRSDDVHLANPGMRALHIRESDEISRPRAFKDNISPDSNYNLTMLAIIAARDYSKTFSRAPNP